MGISKYLGSPTITILVGFEKHKYTVHESLLCEKTCFFETCLKYRTFKEGETRTVSLPEDKIAGFNNFVEWLYTGNFTDFSVNALLESYALADKFMSEDMKCYVIRTICSRCGGTFKPWTATELICASIKMIEKGFGTCSLMFYFLHEMAWRMHMWGYSNFIEDKFWIRFISSDSFAITRVLKLLENTKKRSYKQILIHPSSTTNFWLPPTKKCLVTVFAEEKALWYEDFSKDEVPTKEKLDSKKAVK